MEQTLKVQITQSVRERVLLVGTGDGVVDQ
jgi:hypothetical protein